MIGRGCGSPSISAPSVWPRACGSKSAAGPRSAVCARRPPTSCSLTPSKDRHCSQPKLHKQINLANLKSIESVGSVDSIDPTDPKDSIDSTDRFDIMVLQGDERFRLGWQKRGCASRWSEPS